jgi:hypothetical protein
MKPRGSKKTFHHVEGHQNCGICHPEINNLKAKARLEDKRIVEDELKEAESKDPSETGPLAP